MDIVIEAELEIAVEAYVEPFSASEKVLVIDRELGRYSNQSGGV